MTIQEFYVQMNKPQEAPALQALQALQSCSPEMLQAAPVAGWLPWMNIPQAHLDQSESRN
jgi:hypothetical protein